MKSKKAEYLELRAEWYQKLKDEGFKDIEHHHKDDYANSVTTQSRHFSDEVLRNSVQEYYNMAYHFLNEYKFENEKEKIIWEYYTEGLSYREIAKTLAALGMKHKIDKNSVWRIVYELEKIMKQRYLSV